MRHVSLFFIHGTRKEQPEELRAKGNDIARKSIQVYLFFALDFYSAMTETTWYEIKIQIVILIIKIIVTISFQALFAKYFFGYSSRIITTAKFGITL